MWCSILKEGSDLNIEIHEYYRREKYFGIRHGNKDNVPCRTSIKFDDLWKHLVSEEQEGTKCELIFCSITLDFPQRASANFKVEFENPIQGLHICVVAEVRYSDRYQHVYPRLKLVIGPRLWLERAVCTNQSHNGELEQIQTHFGSSRPCKRCCWNDYGVRKAFKRGKSLLTNTCARYLTRNSWIL